MSSWNRIDLHQHTDHDIDCKGKHVNNNYTHIGYYNLLKEEQVKLKAVTCHNNINIASHIKHAIISDLLGVTHLVGAEIDYKFEKIEFHAISILSPNVDIIKFADTLNKLRNEKNNNIYFNKEDFCNLHKEIEFIFIPHAVKDKGILEQKIGKLERSTIDWVVKSLISGIGEPILFENTRDYYIYAVVEKINKILSLENVDIDIAAYVGDDYKFDNDEQRKEKIRKKVKYSINSLPTYRGLEIAIRNAKTRLSIDSQIIQRSKYIKKISLPNNNIFENSVLELSPGLNIIIGNSGSGKTLLLNEIYYELKKKNLSAAIKDNKKDAKGNQYKNKVGNNNFLNIEFDETPTNINSINILEIPNIYSEILKAQEDSENKIPEMFGIDNTENYNNILEEYKKLMSSYSTLIKNNVLSYKNGEQNIINIKSAIDFINKNKLEVTNYNLNKIVYDDTVLNSFNNKINKLDNYINDKDKIISYFKEIEKLLNPKEENDNVKNIIIYYNQLIENLRLERQITIKKKNAILIDKTISEKINNVIDTYTKMLGNKEKTVKDRIQILSQESNKLINNIKKILQNDIEEKEFCLEFPFEKLKEELEKNSNEYARLSLNITKNELDNIDILDSKIFNLQNVKTKLKDLKIKNFSMLHNEDIKNVISQLSENDISFSNLIITGDGIPKNVELFMSETKEWKSIENINKGDIAKKSIEYYFKKLIKENQPNIILIDQPENDVDKTFISTTLSNFIKEQKTDKQIIVTSHDAIIAINSDVNKIIQANVNDKNKIEYESYDLEYVEEEKLIATNKVSTILDGGKNNIKIRYQIYGGELNYENKNI